VHAGTAEPDRLQQGGVEGFLLPGGEGQGEPVALLGAGPRQRRQRHPGRGRGLGVAGRTLQRLPWRKHQAEQHRRRRRLVQVPGQPQQLEGQQAVAQPGRHRCAPGAGQIQLLLQPPRQHQRPAQLPPLARVAVAAAAEHPPRPPWCRGLSLQRHIRPQFRRPARPRQRRQQGPVQLAVVAHRVGVGRLHDHQPGHGQGGLGSIHRLCDGISMDRVTVSPKYQVVIPRRVREQYGLSPGQTLQVIALPGRIELVPSQPPAALRGFLQGKNTFQREGDRL